MNKDGYIEVFIAVRRRDSDYNIVGKSAQTGCEVDLKDFENLVQYELEGAPLPKGARLTSVKKRTIVADKIKRTLDRLFSGAIDG